MKIIVSKQIESLTGSLGAGYGYHIQQRKNGFFAKRNTKGSIPPDGHLRFIFLCAELAQNRLYVSDVEVRKQELEDALREADLDTLVRTLPSSIGGLRGTLSASDIINFKTSHNL